MQVLELIITIAGIVAVEIVLFRFVFLPWIWDRIVDGLAEPDEHTQQAIGSLGMGIIANAINFYMLGCQDEKPDGVKAAIWKNAQEYTATIDSMINRISHRIKKKLTKEGGGPGSMKDQIVGGLLEKILGGKGGPKQGGSGGMMPPGWG